ncbi:hypothetical protein CCP3SC1_150026 [Gammaproteobacteria bacterium]
MRNKKSLSLRREKDWGECKNLLIRQHHALTPGPSPGGREEKNALGSNLS